MHVKTYITLFGFLLIQEYVYALPATPPPPVPRSLPLNHTRRRDPLETEKVILDGKEYTAEPITHMDQGYYSASFKITGGFQVGDKRVPAVLKRVWEEKAEDVENSKTRQEIGFLKRDSIGLHLFHKWSDTKNKDGKYDVDIVVRDIGEEDPPFKPFYKWYVEDETLDGFDALRKVRENIEDRLLWYATEENLLYKDFNKRNIFLRKIATSEWGARRAIDSSVRVMPIDWGPPERYAGVVDIADKANKSELIQRYATKLRDQLVDTFSVEALHYELRNYGYQLRRGDIDRTEFGGMPYYMVHVRSTPHDRGNTYKILGGFEGKPALLNFAKIESPEEGMRAIQGYNQRGILLDSRLDPKEVCIIYEDVR